MKILSWNVNGLRAVYKRNFLNWFKESRAEIVCLQEIKIQKEQLLSDLINPQGYFSYFNFAVKKGYSGLAVYTKERPVGVKEKLGLKRFDEEGRFLELEFPNFILINIYLPHGGRAKEKLGYKLEAYYQLISYLGKIKEKKVVLIGDFNVAHEEIDLARPKENRDNIMFTPEERKQIDQIIEMGFQDSFRRFNQESGRYTWWPYSFGARERNLGWRIDYAFIAEALSQNLKNAFILKEVGGSDHCPIGVSLTKTFN